MSKMMLRSSGKPPLARSPIRLRPRRSAALQPTSSSNAARTPPGSLMKSQLPNRTGEVERSELRPPRAALQPTSSNAARTPLGSLVKPQLPPTRTWDVENSELRPEYHTMSCELRALAKMVHQELGTGVDNTLDGDNIGGQRSPLFERGRFYDLYSARRNERLKRKKAEMEGYEKKSSYDLGVRVESAKKRETSKFDSRRKTVVAMAAAATPVAQRREAMTPRYSLRSSTSKENKKPPLPVMMSVEKSVGVTERKVGARRVRKI